MSVLRFRVVLLLVAAGIHAWWLWFRPTSAWVETQYSRGFYALYASVVGPVASAFPFSLAALLIVLLLLVPLLRAFWPVVAGFSKPTRTRSRGAWPTWVLALWSLTQNVFVASAIFTLTWGINYAREPLAQSLHLDTAPIAQRDATALLAKLEGVVRANSNSVPNEAQALVSLRAALEDVAATHLDTRIRVPDRVKIAPPGWLLRLGGASGIMTGLTAEAHVDGALVPFDRVAVAAHELAHVVGFAQEADADAFGALAGLRANNAFVRYATALRQWWFVANQLGAETQGLARLPARAQRDLQAMLEAYQRFRVPVWLERLQRLSYDAYLKRQGVTAGVGDYSRATQVLVRMMRARLLPQ